ncbi:hypothetical protein OEIGOIKO_05794 [Streptomyces chrestomyceticus JCM 4735]|uniref:Uncharacterized protein n=1 Tax=Streptomyces chrestomyceticus JCM 4735 TaxID=1306181 RepID=A0A7U9KYY4_9ACTN|nr:hypothetical protein [Streptomyces chrestomyceticus]GCD37984.1 hypothetical protein OEIGOIKO_05794 [Streptomyces chrestomyceticus JCM 4735]
MTSLPPPMDEDAGRILRFGEALDALGQDTGDFIVRISLRAITGEPIGEKILSRRELERLTDVTESLVSYSKDDEAETAPGGNGAWTLDSGVPGPGPEVDAETVDEIEQVFTSIDLGEQGDQ